MKALLTGMNGTVAPALAKRLEAEGYAVCSWDRSKVPTDNPDACRRFIESESPDWFFQIATGSPDWIEQTAAVCKEQGITFIHTGSVSVFDGSKSGPFPKDHPTDAGDDYGKYKADCERRVLAVNPDAIIARLGWQIGEAPGSNNMIDFLTTQQREHGKIEASTGWIPSTAFLVDTADGLFRLASDYTPGLYQLEGNPNGMTFHDLVTALNTLHGGDWDVVAKNEAARDNRMLEDKIVIGAINERLT